MTLRSLLAVAAVVLSVGSLASADDRPNIIFVLVDDMGYSDLGCFGGEGQTPNLDRLAGEGVRFRQFYNGGKCEPTRSMIITGQYWPSVGLAGRGPTLGDVLSDAGYRTLAVGKWHLDGKPTDRGFDRYFGHLSGASPFFTVNDTWLLDDQPFTKADAGEGFYATDAMGDYAIDFIREAVAEHADQPFLLYLAFNAPHDPLQAPEADVQRYLGKFMDGWDVLRERRVERMRTIGLIDDTWPIPERPEEVPAWDSLSDEAKQVEDRRMAVYAAMIDRVDQNVGKVLTELDKLGIAENTLIVFMSDNGASPYDRVRAGIVGEPGSHWNHGLGWAYLANTPYRKFKRQQHMGGNLTAAIAHWPDGLRNPGRIDDTPLHVIDLMPTFLDLAGVDHAQDDAPCASFRPLLEDAPPPAEFGERALHFQLLDHGAVISEGRKLVRANGGEWELYNLAADRAETHDLIATHPALRDDLMALYTTWFEANDLRWNDGGPQPDYRPIGEDARE